MLYKYRKFRRGGASQIKDILIRRQLWRAMAPTLNDPYDCLPIITIPSKGDELVNFLKQLSSDFPKAFSGITSERDARAWIEENRDHLPCIAAVAVKMTRSKLSVLSFSRYNDIFQLWSGYSDSFRGICLGFDDKDQDSFLSKTKRVIYSKTRPKFEWKAQFSDIEQEAFLLTKTADWSYEQEVRNIGIRVSGGVEYPAKALRTVTFGERCNSYNRQKVFAWLEAGGHTPTFYEAKAHGGTVRVEPLSV